MNKSYSSRERVLLAILPATMVLVIYSFLIALPKQRGYQQTLTRLETTRQTAIKEVDALESAANLKAAREAANRLRERLADDRMTIKTQSQQWRNLEARLETVQELTEMMGQYNLSIITQDYQDEPAVSQYLIELFQEIDAESPAIPPVEYWQIEVQGGYNEVQAFLAAIDRERMKTFPITVNMDASDSTNGLHKWTIIFVV